VQPPQTPPTSADSAKLDHHTGAGQRLQLVIALGLGDSQPLFEQKSIAILTGAIDQYSKLIPVFSLLIVQFAPVSANTVGFGKSCGGIGGIKCDAGLWCDPRPGQCGQTDLKGRCVKVPTVCPMWSGVCGCDNKTYSNDCERVMAQAQKAHQGKCTGNPKY
jgi:hypothetical protein